MLPEAVLTTLTLVWQVLKSAGNESAIAGGVAISYWGNPRSTQDIDVAVFGHSFELLDRRFRQAGFKALNSPMPLGLFILSQFTFEPEETFIEVDIDLLLGTSEYYKTAIGRAVEVRLDGIPMSVRILTREDLIVHKLAANRLIDQADVQNLLEMHWQELDQDYLNSWTGKLDITAEFQTAIERYREQKDLP